ncbi:PAS domain-containing protein [uncultured Desulfovibrio sp.]|uniref:helix-turn-helix transcriptional regulator n=1 Tax=uncultured Desulfovibrio sp. TaxID=167968 RepID=UPI0026206644|nr:PAS domain-containing protein [uncultured Desulfovibrio sp.]
MDKQAALKSLGHVTDALANFFGRYCEIVIHDVEQLEHSLVHISGNVTGRQIGAPATDLLIKHLAKWGDAAPDLPPYKTRNAAGQPMKSALTFFRDENGKILAAVCINMDISVPTRTLALLEEMVRTSGDHEEGTDNTETFATNMRETTDALIRKVLDTLDKQPEELNRNERIALVHDFEEAGVFHFKGMVEEVAEIMGISKFTLYSYRKCSLTEPKEGTSTTS